MQSFSDVFAQAGNSALHLAAANGKKEMVQWLMENVMNDVFKSKNGVSWMLYYM
jgi:hypothetical protein